MPTWGPHGTHMAPSCWSPDPDEGVVELWVDGLQVLDGQLLAQHLLVEGHAEAVVDELAVIQRLRERGRSERDLLRCICTIKLICLMDAYAVISLEFLPKMQSAVKNSIYMFVFSVPPG